MAAEVTPPEEVVDSIVAHVQQVWNEMTRDWEEGRKPEKIGRSWTVNGPAGLTVDLSFTTRIHYPENGSTTSNMDRDQGNSVEDQVTVGEDQE